MREEFRALYYPDFYFEYPTLIKCILLFDEIHLMDRPSRTFDGQTLTIGAGSPMRQFEQSFRDNGVPVYVHEPPSGFVAGELLGMVEADLLDPSFIACFQEGLRSSPHFRTTQIQPGNYGNNETHETILEKLSAIDLGKLSPPLKILRDQSIRPFDFTTSQGLCKTFVQKVAFCSANMNSALSISARESFSPLADASPYATLLSAKYSRAITAATAGGTYIPVTDLSIAIIDELIPSKVLREISVEDAIRLRKESESQRAAFLEHVLSLQASLGEIPTNGDYAAVMNKIIATEIRPAASDYCNKLETIWETFLGKLAKGAVGWASSSAAVQLFGDLTWTNLLSLGTVASAYVAKEVIGAIIDTRAASRDCALSFLLDLREE